MYQITYKNLLYNKSYVKDVSVKFVANMTPYSQAWKTILHNFFSLYLKLHEMEIEFTL